MNQGYTKIFWSTLLYYYVLFSDCQNMCHHNATCTVFADGFNCSCNSGFSGDGVSCQGRELVKYIANAKLYIATGDKALLLFVYLRNK